MNCRFTMVFFIAFASNFLFFVQADDFKTTQTSISFKRVYLLKGHKDIVQVLIISKNGLLVSGSADTTIRIWAMDGKNIKCLGNHADWINSLAELPNGHIACGSNSGDIKIWDLDKQESTALTNLAKEDCYGAAAIVLQNGNIAFGSIKREIKFWDLKTDACVKIIDQDLHKSWISSLVEINDSNIIASSSWDSTVKIWDMSHDKLNVKTFVGHTDCVNVVIQVDSETLASGADDNKIIVWDIASGEKRAVLCEHTDRIYALTSGEGKIFSGSRDKTVKIWDPQTQTCLATIQCEDKIHSLAYFTDKKYLFVGLSRGDIEVFKLSFTAE